MYSYMDDCKHLKACRRLQKILKGKGVTVGRNCNYECSAYEREELQIDRDAGDELIDFIAFCKEDVSGVSLTDSSGYQWFIYDMICEIQQRAVKALGKEE